MLISFRIKNFRSFSDEMIFSMRPVSAYRENPENIAATKEGVKILKVAALYGPNAGGKSNVIRALGTMRREVLQSLKKSSVDFLGVEPFALDNERLRQPTLFEISMLIGAKVYRYGFAATANAVVAEWLGQSAPGLRAIEHMLFAREANCLDSFNKRCFPELTGFRMSTLLQNALLLPRLDQLNNPVARAVMKWFKDLSVLSGSRSGDYGVYSSERIEDADFHSRMMQFVRFADMSIGDVVVRKQKVDWSEVPETVRQQLPMLARPDKIEQHEVCVARETRQGGTVLFDMDEKESEGTIKMFELSGPLADILNQGTVLVIDEMEAKLHPLLTKRIVRVFNSSKTNPRNAQLIFVTHDATLLHQARLRRDQIWFCEKNCHGESTAYCLAEIRSTAKARREDNLEKKYLEGRFGAIPSFPAEEL